MRFGKKIGVALLGSAALALWAPTFCAGAPTSTRATDARDRASDARGPAHGPAHEQAHEPGHEPAYEPERLEPGAAEPAPTRAPRPVLAPAERARALLAMDVELPDGQAGSLEDLAALADSGPSAGARMRAGVWDELALRWALRVASVGKTQREDAR